MGRPESSAPGGAVLLDLADAYQLPETLSQGFHSKHFPSLHPDSPCQLYARTLISPFRPLRGEGRVCLPTVWAAHLQDRLLGIWRPSKDDVCASSLSSGLPARACPTPSLSGWVGDQLLFLYQLSLRCHC